MFERDPYGFERFAQVARLRCEVSGACTRPRTCRNASIILKSQDGMHLKFQNRAEMLAFSLKSKTYTVRFRQCMYARW